MVVPKDHVLKFDNDYFDVIAGANSVNIRLVKPLPKVGSFGRGKFFRDNRFQTVKMWTGGGKALVEALDAISAKKRAWMWHSTDASKQTNIEVMKPDRYKDSDLVRNAGVSEEAMKRIKKETVLLQKTYGDVVIDVREHKFVLAQPGQILRANLSPDTFDVIVVDEGDVGAQETTHSRSQGGTHWYQALDKFPDSWVTFYTATDERSDITARRHLTRPFVTVTHAELLHARANKGIRYGQWQCKELQEKKEQVDPEVLKDLQAGFWKSPELLQHCLELVLKKYLEDRSTERMPGPMLVFVADREQLRTGSPTLKCRDSPLTVALPVSSIIS
jgi:hypothetical protein